MDDDVAVERAKTISAADHFLAAAKHAAATVRALPETPYAVMSLRRMDTNMFEAELLSATMWKGDAQLLKTMPQGEARRGWLHSKQKNVLLE